jgi:uncharacterized protein (DUF2062 family)
MVKGMLGKQIQSARETAAMVLRQGITPRRLALTLALGFAIGCFPVVGVPTAMCAVLAMSLRLNLPVIQAANYLVMPLQLLLLVPFIRLGAWAVSSGQQQPVNFSALLQLSHVDLMKQVGAYTGHALVGWLLIALPAVVLMTAMLTVLLRRVPALAAAEAGD